MPKEARYLIRTSLVYLAAALLAWMITPLSSLLGLQTGLSLHVTALHLFTVGWLTQLIFGVAFWLFPAPSRSARYGKRSLVWLTYALMNVGLLLRAAIEPFGISDAPQAWGLATSAVLQWLGVLLFVAYIWPRIKQK